MAMKRDLNLFPEACLPVGRCASAVNLVFRGARFDQEVQGNQSKFQQNPIILDSNDIESTVLMALNGIWPNRKSVKRHDLTPVSTVLQSCLEIPESCHLRP